VNSKQRCLAAIHGAPVDRTPVFPLIMFLAADRLGKPYRLYATDGSVLADAQLTASNWRKMRTLCSAQAVKSLPAYPTRSCALFAMRLRNSKRKRT
jgi:hypothetical protein